MGSNQEIKKVKNKKTKIMSEKLSSLKLWGVIENHTLIIVMIHTHTPRKSVGGTHNISR